MSIVKGSKIIKIVSAVAVLTIAFLSGKAIQKHEDDKFIMLQEEVIGRAEYLISKHDLYNADKSNEMLEYIESSNEANSMYAEYLP